jgi:hypothetical protein
VEYLSERYSTFWNLHFWRALPLKSEKLTFESAPRLIWGGSTLLADRYRPGQARNTPSPPARASRQRGISYVNLRFFSYEFTPVHTRRLWGGKEPGFTELVALNPQPSTLNPQPSTLNPQPSTLNPQPSTLNPQPSTLNPQPSSLNPQSSTLNSES